MLGDGREEPVHHRFGDHGRRRDRIPSGSKRRRKEILQARRRDHHQELRVYTPRVLEMAVLQVSSADGNWQRDGQSASQADARRPSGDLVLRRTGHRQPDKYTDKRLTPMPRMPPGEWNSLEAR